MWEPTSATRDQTCISCIGRQILDHWTNRKVLILPNVLIDMEAFHPFFFISGMEWWRSLLAYGAQAVFPFEYSMGHFSGILEGELDSCVYIIFPRSHIDFKCPSLAQQLILWFEVRKQFCTFFGSTGMPEWLGEGFSSAPDLKIPFTEWQGPCF